MCTLQYNLRLTVKLLVHTLLVYTGRKADCMSTIQRWQDLSGAFLDKPIRRFPRKIQCFEYLEDWKGQTAAEQNISSTAAVRLASWRFVFATSAKQKLHVFIEGKSVNVVARCIHYGTVRRST